MVLKSISDRDLSKDEMLLLLNESSISVAVEEQDCIVTANSIFFELTGSDPDESCLKLSSIYTPESYTRVERNKTLILETLQKSQTVRNENKTLQVNIKAGHKKIRCTLDLVFLSDEPKPRWGHKLINCERLQLHDSQVQKMEKLKDSLLNLSQSLLKIKDIRNFYDLVLEAAGNIITHGSFCTILRLDETKDNFVPVASRGYSWETMKQYKLPVKESFSWRKLGHLLDRTIIFDDVETLFKPDEDEVVLDGKKLRASIQTPIIVDGEFYGILTMDSTETNAFTDADFNIIEYLRSQIQIALENQLLYNQIQHKASHDELTDVVSRGAFQEQVIKFLSTKHHYESCCIVMMDLNDLKVVNDIWGHSAGDEYLLRFVTIMKQHMRGSDVLARLGGDEFAICFYSSQSAQFIERLKEIQDYLVDNPLAFGGRKVSCWFSYGIAHCPEDGETYDILINTADERMYELKSEMKSKKLKNDLHDYRQ
ncbi:MAG: sensor domain-containing diguanylate cyclase [Spirochaetales bacterium]|uniref:diguanylate cyclase n=1 Tax=Candidatus Thalassospirochaeta sargassi TaxID=3119039 RepID=A0AAJ1IJ27_9SPIO|nr:sensor domain-containing diguanylate cyclase [Spirochaetales bacterium]